jgi:hypothetical protein
MKDQSIRATALTLLTCSAFALCIFVGQPAVADGRGKVTTFTNGSLQGRYAYINNTGNVASLGPIIFNGHGGLDLKLVTNTPCESPAPGCSRGTVVSTYLALTRYNLMGPVLRQSTFLNQLGR